MCERCCWQGGDAREAMDGTAGGSLHLFMVLETTALRST
jgi:hypothetical protein